MIITPNYRENKNTTFAEIHCINGKYHHSEPLSTDSFSEMMLTDLYRLRIHTYDQLLEKTPSDISNKKILKAIRHCLEKLQAEDDDVSFAAQFGVEKENMSMFSSCIDEHSLSVRSRNVLQNLEVETVSDLLQLSPSTLKSTRNIGAKSYKELFNLVRLAMGDDYDQKNAVNKSCALPSLFVEHKEEILSSDFSFCRGLSLSEEEQDIYEKMKTAIEIMSIDFVNDVANKKTGTIQVIKTLDTLVNEYYQVYSDRRKIEEVLFQIPVERRNRPCRFYIDAFMTQGEKRELLSEYICGENDTLSTYVHRITGNSLNDTELIIRFLKWCTFDLKNDISGITKEISQDERSAEILSSRGNGRTLNEIGGELVITRERVRQIEKKALKSLGRKISSKKILLKIYAEREGDEVLTPSELAEYFGEATSMFLHALRNVESQSFSYDDTVDAFVVENGSLNDQVMKYIDALPSAFNKRELDFLIERGVKEFALNGEYLEKAIINEYKLTADTYHRERLTLGEIYKTITLRYYPEGLKLYDPKTLEQVRAYIKQDFGEIKLPDKDRAVSARIADNCILCGRGVYKPKQDDYISRRLLKQITAYIDELDTKIVSISSLFYVFSQELAQEGIDNRYYLQGILHELCGSKYSFRRDYIFKEGAGDSFYTEIVGFIKQNDYPVSKEQIKHYFPGLSEVVINFAVQDEDILNFFGSYIHVSKIKMQKHEEVEIRDLIDELLQSESIIHCQIVFDRLMNNNALLLKRNGIFYQYSLFSMLRRIFRDEYEFSRPFIGEKGNEIVSPMDAVLESLEGQEVVNIDELLELSRGKGLVIPSVLEFLDSLNDEYILANKRQVAKYDELGLSESMIKGVIDMLETEVSEVQAIRDLACIYRFPAKKDGWNEWTIYSLVNQFADNLDVAASQEQFRFSVPVIAKRGNMDKEKIAELDLKDTEDVTIEVNDLDDLDSLIDDLISDEE